MLSLRMAILGRAIRPAFATVSKATLLRPSVCQAARMYAHGPGPLTKELVQERILGLMGNFDRIDPTKLSATASFREDLDLDSLDIVDVLFYVEEEFSVQMPDHEANNIKTVPQAVDWVLAQHDAF